MSTPGRRSPITTHVLDQSQGKPAADIEVALEKDGKEIARARTNADGRIEDWGPVLAPGSKAEPAVYSLVFETNEYFLRSGQKTFYPSVIVRFRVERPEQHHHVPLLLSPYGYSTYRGT